MTPDLKRHLRPRRLLGCAALLASLALASCGGNGDLAGVDSGGTGSFAVGAINGFGSVIVNGTRYHDRRASVVDASGAPRSSDDLKLGMVVEVDSSTPAPAPAGSAYAREAEASRIRFGAGIVGPLHGVDLASSRITVLGQDVGVGPDTIYGEELAGGLLALAALPTGAILEINGFPDFAAVGRYAATRIDLVSDPAHYVLSGIIQDLDTRSSTFRIGGAQMDYLALGVDQARSAGVVDGGIARVDLGVIPRADGTWVILQPASTPLPIADRDDFEIEGIVTAFTTTTMFEVNGLPVDASRARIDLDSGDGRLVLGSRVEIEGQIRDGILIAREIELEDDGNDRGQLSRPGSQSGGKPIFLSGPITAVDLADGQFRVRGVRVNVASASILGGQLPDLRNGIKVEIDARLSPDGASVDAIEIRFVSKRADPDNANQPRNDGNGNGNGNGNRNNDD